MAQVRTNYSNPVELRIAGYEALEKALGAENAALFMKQNCPCSGDYTKEKYEQPDISVDELYAMIEEYERTKAAS
ncbi:MAG: hypothetical protein LUC38_03740 [Oscillospiraceae bacterium]|nr:hypothetical protein [Ruminococcus sp.]MCD8345056.1 hypothetical protein [Oscillospiraceae bacterium]